MTHFEKVTKGIKQTNKKHKLICLCAKMLGGLPLALLDDFKIYIKSNLSMCELFEFSKFVLHILGV